MRGSSRPPRVPTLEGTPSERRAAALAPLRVVAADRFLRFDLAETPGGYRYWGIACEGADDLVAGSFAIEGTPSISPFDPSRPERSAINRFRPGVDALLDTVKDYTEHPLWTQHYGPLGLRYERRMLVYDNDVFRGWIGVSRCIDHVRFTRQEDASLERVSKRVRRLVIADAALRDRDLPGGQAFVTLRPDGSVESACDEASTWLTHDRTAALAGATRRLDRDEDPGEHLIGGVVARPVRLGGDGPSRYLWVLSPARRPRRSAGARLSPRVAEVAALAAAGATVPEVARRLGISTHTVREHLKSAYQELGVGSRVELARTLQQEK